MRVVVNKTSRPLKIHLPQGKTLHLGPRKEGQVTAQALESPGVKRLVEAGDLADTHGHHPSTTLRQRGDR